ncbi:hypothetical protein [Planomonospora parontospora]|uniref:hypothetical protein n=1 Tax=Planomonospora parontospora TaxID=58119 RepID=UPI001670FC7E|nr:hypothetical protein [Planomonospora parontospora]GGL50249.1 hypothetical protein GCM10014719_59440 [Planomonospora parontospora subsp. antibiotica]GII18962.1 hypothetical protein Ppa05_56880 [Planomonospora parontospora subsp. antibiotica]
MRHLNPPDAGGEPVCGPCFSASRPPLPMGCAVCGHPPYDHGCLHVDEHDYQAPSGAQIRARQHLIRAARLDEQGMPATAWVRPSMCVPVAAEETPVEEVLAVPVPRTAEPAPQAVPRSPVPVEPQAVPRSPVPVEPQAAPWPPVPVEPGWRPVEPREARAVRLARARVPAALQRARARAATARSRPPHPAPALDVGRPVSGGPPSRSAGRLRPGEPTAHHTASRSPDPPGSTRWRSPYEVAEVNA